MSPLDWPNSIGQLKGFMDKTLKTVIQALRDKQVREIHALYAKYSNPESTLLQNEMKILKENHGIECRDLLDELKAL